jgi:CheY-like chemotaxis protein/HPt (histidine-containing phosphotransfer) domain-containing protein
MTPPQRRQAETAYHSAESLLTILNDILDFSKIEAGKLEFDLTPFDLREMAEDVTHLLVAPARDRRLELIVHYAPSAPTRLVGDAGRMRQVLLNLVGNAIKFTPQGHVLISVDGRPAPDGRHAMHLAVTDTGIGISEDNLDAIFDKFTQADASTTRKFGGTGLGLAISRRLVEMMGGRLWAESTVGKGSTFHVEVSLPVDTAAAAAAAPPEVALADLAGRHVLVVDDHPVNRDVLDGILRGWNMRTGLADSGPAALAAQAAARQAGDPFSLAVVDACMPEMDGLEVCRRLLADPAPHLKAVVMLSSTDHGCQAARCRTMGVHSYLIKPVRQAELLKVLLGAVGKSLESSKEAAPAGESTVRRPPLHVLLAEDNLVNQEVATALLQELQCSVVLACNGLEAVSAIQREHFDLVFMDLEMPEMGGLEATAKIREWEQATGARTPIIAMTARAMKADLDGCLQCGMDDYITKPVSGRRLAEAIDKVVRTESAETAPTCESASPAPTSEAAAAPDACSCDPSAPGPSSQAAVDIADLLNRCMQKPQIADRVLEKFQQSVPGLMRQLEQTLECGDIEKAGRHAHMLKGAAANISAGALEAAADLVCRQCRAGSEAAARTTVLSVNLELSRCLAQLPQARQELTATAK